jgi:hypothetical protein
MQQQQRRRLISQDAKIGAQAFEIRDLKQQQKQEIAAEDAKIRNLEQQFAELVSLQSKDNLVAQR